MNVSFDEVFVRFTGALGQKVGQAQKKLAQGALPDSRKGCSGYYSLSTKAACKRKNPQILVGGLSEKLNLQLLQDGLGCRWFLDIRFVPGKSIHSDWIKQR
jgi:hypothetical protein